jgi:hypothetical protein
MLKARDLKFFAIGAVIVASGLSVFAAVNIPNTFTPNTPIKADEVNANFSSLKASIEALQASSGTVADGAITSSKLADGAVLTGKLSTQNTASSGKFLSFNGSSLVWSDGTVGTVGPQGSKGDTGAVGLKGDTGAQGVKGDTGAVGPAGGVSGYEQVFVNIVDQRFAADSIRTFSANCPSTKRVVGGGWIGINVGPVALATVTDVPSSPTQWSVALTPNTASATSASVIQVYAICVNAI